MPTLQEKMAENGFESNDHYDYHVRCLLSNPTQGLRCLNVDGESERRNTAFASALAHALEYPHILYHDFTQKEPPAPVININDDEEIAPEVPLSTFERTVIESCAFSEAEPSILILDQLHTADFSDHLRIYKFIKTAQWEQDTGCYFANSRNLLLFLISSQPLYHSLRKCCFRVWVSAKSSASRGYMPEDFNLSDDALDMMLSFSQLFTTLNQSPTWSEYAKILYDAEYNIHTLDDLRYSLLGWIEALEQDQIFSEHIQTPLQETLQAIEAYIGFDELEITGSAQGLMLVNPDRD